MSAGRVSAIAASLGNIQHARSEPRVPESPDTQIPKGPGPRVLASPLPLQGTAKRSHPDYVQLKAYVRADTKRAAMRKAEDEGHEDFSELIQELLAEYLNTRGGKG